jgi:hypothetical protein
VSRIRRLSLVAVAASAAVVLVGCGPTAAPAPVDSGSPTPTATETTAPVSTKPPLGELVLSTEGLGTIGIGAAPTTGADALVAFDNEACTAQGLPGIWLSTYPNIDEGFGPDAPFAIALTGSVVSRIDVNTEQIYTDTGIHIGSSLDEVLGVYSGGPDQVLNHADVSDVYVIKGTKGQLLFEVAVDRIPDYWDPAVIDTVVFLGASSIDIEPYGIAATDNKVGVCSHA